jgi:hypothetical protein
MDRVEIGVLAQMLEVVRSRPATGDGLAEQFDSAREVMLQATSMPAWGAGPRHSSTREGIKAGGVVELDLGRAPLGAQCPLGIRDNVWYRPCRTKTSPHRIRGLFEPQLHDPEIRHRAIQLTDRTKRSDRCRAVGRGQFDGLDNPRRPPSFGQPRQTSGPAW